MRWRGVETQGGAGPPRLESATAAHLALALRPLGAGLVPGPPFDAEALARCQFTDLKHAQCQVEVLAGELHAQRRADVPFRDADDLAESIALLVSGMLQTDFADLPTQLEIQPEPPVPTARPAPTARPPASTARLPPAPTARPNPPTPTTTTRPVETVQKRPAPLERGNLLLAVGPSAAVGFSGDPALFGASLRALYLSRRILRAGGSLGLEGSDVSRGGYDLSFFRLVMAPRVGVGLTQGRVDVDLTVGPALHVLHGRTDGASHTLTSVALVLGARLGVMVGGGFWVEAGLDVLGSLQEEKVVAGPTEVTRFGHWWLDLALALVYRR